MYVPIEPTKAVAGCRTVAKPTSRVHGSAVAAGGKHMAPGRSYSHNNAGERTDILNDKLHIGLSANGDHNNDTVYMGLW